MTANNLFIKNPAAVLDYKFDWKAATNGADGADGDWLGTTETIASRTVTATTGITVDSSTLTDTNTSVTVWLSGGTAGVTYTVTCRIVTSANRTDERSIRVRVQDR